MASGGRLQQPPDKIQQAFFGEFGVVQHVLLRAVLHQAIRQSIVHGESRRAPGGKTFVDRATGAALDDIFRLAPPTLYQQVKPAGVCKGDGQRPGVNSGDTRDGVSSSIVRSVHL